MKYHSDESADQRFQLSLALAKIITDGRFQALWNFEKVCYQLCQMYLVEGCDGAASWDAESEDGEARGGDEAVPVPRLLQPDSGGQG